MRLLTLYLVRQNIFLVFMVLLVGTGLYLLSDIFERLDDFLNAGLGMFDIFTFFIIKTPSIISQILPAVFLLALVVQLNILERSRELTALQAGGISYGVLVRFVLIYGCIWAGGQLVFSQVVGVAGDRFATRMWQEQVRGKNPEDRDSVGGLWFTDGNQVLHVGHARPDHKDGTELLVYRLDDSGVGIVEILKASRFRIEKKHWVLQYVTQLEPNSFKRTQLAELIFPIKQDLKAFQVTESIANAEQLPFWELTTVIKRLQGAGSNVEGLRTAWHNKLAYAFSIVVMGMLALTISQLTDNIYKAMGYALFFVFFFYCVNIFCVSMGQRGMVTPFIGAWFANIAGLGLTLCWFVWPVLRQRLHR